MGEDSPPPEESEASHSAEFIIGERISGGGEGGWERLVEDPDSNPEMGSLLRDFLRERHRNLIDKEGQFDPNSVLDFGIEFDEWQDEDSEGMGLSKRPSNPNWTRRIELDRVGYGSPVYDKLADLGKVWTDSGTQITYIVNEEQGEDKIIFKNPRLKWRSVKDSGERSFTIKELNEVLDQSDIGLSISRPKNGDDRRFVQDLKHIRLGAGILAGKNVDVQFSEAKQEQIKEDKNFFTLKLNDRALEKYGTKEEKGAVEDFWGLWTHAGKGEITWMGFETDKDGKITGVTLVEKEAGWKDRVTVPAHVFRAVFDNVLPHNEDRVSTGFEFIVPQGMREYVHSGRSVEDIAHIMKKVKINGVGLQENVKFFIGSRFQKEQF